LIWLLALLGNLRTYYTVRIALSIGPATLDLPGAIIANLNRQHLTAVPTYTIHLDSMTELTVRQQQVLGFIQTEDQAGRPAPTLREIARRFGFRAHRAAACHLLALKTKRLIQWEPGKARSIKVISPLQKPRTPIVNIPLFGSVPAGFAQDLEQEAEGCVSVDVGTIGFTPTRTTFALRVAGDSMIGRHIIPGDVVILEHNAEPREGQIVAALIDGQTTLKTFLRRNGKPYLKAENPRYPDLIPAQELVIQGVFRALVRKAPY
jgi:repressor LexA